MARFLEVLKQLLIATLPAAQNNLVPQARPVRVSRDEARRRR